MISAFEHDVDLLARHLQIFQLVRDNEPIGIVRISNETSYPHHKVRYSLHRLEENNLVEPTDQGAITTDQAVDFIEGIDDDIDGVIQRLNRVRIDSDSTVLTV